MTMLAAARLAVPRGCLAQDPAVPGDGLTVEERPQRLEEPDVGLLEQNRMLLERLDTLSTK